MELNALTRDMPEDERPRLLAHLLALGPEDRRLRFGHMMSDDGIGKYVEGIDLSRDAVFVVTDAELAVIGAAHLARKENEAELGVSVLPDDRGRGIRRSIFWSTRQAGAHRGPRQRACDAVDQVSAELAGAGGRQRAEQGARRVTAPLRCDTRRDRP